MASDLDRRRFLGLGLGSAGLGSAGLGFAGHAVGAAAGELVAARIRPDGWTIDLDFAAIGRGGRINPAALRLRVTPPEADFLGVSMAGIRERPVSGAAANINPWYDSDNPLGDATEHGGILSVPVRLDRPVRGQERVELSLEAGFLPGTRAARMIAANASALKVSRHAQDRYRPGEPSTLLAEIDCLTGCRIPDEKLKPVSALPTKLDPAHPLYPNIAFDPRHRRIFVGAGHADTGPRILSGIDLRADEGGGYYVQANARNVVIRDCLFDDANIYCIQSSGAVTGTYKVCFNEMRGALERTRGDFSTLPKETRGHSAFFMRHLECESEVRLNRIHGSTNDGVIIIRGTCAQNAIYSQGWDNRSTPGHADGIWCATMVPGAPKLLVERNFVDSRDPGHGFYSITGSLGISLAAIQMHRSIPIGEAYYDGLVVRGNMMLSHRGSYNMAQSLVCLKSGEDRRYIRRLHIHDNWFTHSDRIPNSTPLYPWSHPNHRWSPDGRWINNVDPTTGKVWVMGPQPKDMEFAITAVAPAAKPGETIAFILTVGRYLAQYGPERLSVAEDGGGFARSLDQDIRAAIRDYEGLRYDRGILTFSSGLVGRGLGCANESVKIEIRRTLKPDASGLHVLTIHSNSAGTILSRRATCEIT